jgi:hypothetical protein
VSEAVTRCVESAVEVFECCRVYVTDYDMRLGLIEVIMITYDDNHSWEALRRTGGRCVALAHASQSRKAGRQARAK